MNNGCSTITYGNYNDITPEMFQTQRNTEMILHKMNKNINVLSKSQEVFGSSKFVLLQSGCKSRGLWKHLEKKIVRRSEKVCANFVEN